VASVLRSRERAGPSAGKVSKMRRLGNDFSSDTSSSFISAQLALLPFRMAVAGSVREERATVFVSALVVAEVEAAVKGVAELVGGTLAEAETVWITTPLSISIDIVAMGAHFSSLELLLLSAKSIVASTSFAALSAMESELLFAIGVTIVAVVERDWEGELANEERRVVGEVKEAFLLGVAFLRGRVLKSSITKSPTEARATRELGYLYSFFQQFCEV